MKELAMSNELTTLDLKGQTNKVLKKANMLKWGIGIGVAILLGPLIWALVYAVAGAALLGFMTLFIATVGLAVINMAPVVASKMANKRIEMLKQEARTKPIETLQNQYREKMAALDAFKEKISKFATKVKNYDMQMSEFKQNFPNDAAQFEEISSKMNKLLIARQNKWQEGRERLSLFWKEIEKFDGIWQMTLASSDLREAAGDLDDSFQQQLQRGTAINAVQAGLASSLADLDMLMMEEVSMITPTMLTSSKPEPVPLNFDIPVAERV
jgi:hypothetical protein